MVFEIGKCYRHESGLELKIVGEAIPTLYGQCLVAEGTDGNLHPVGMREENTLNFTEISEEEWMKNFTTENPKIIEEQGEPNKLNDEETR
jgi:hypothetical protein